jgi:hypothetical protein
MNTPNVERPGISAILMGSEAARESVLDLAAVLEGLVSGNFEIIVVGASSAPTTDALSDLRASARGLPLRFLEARSAARGCDAAVYDLIFVRVADGAFDVRELNHLLEAVENGADVAVGYRPRRTDGIVRRLQRWGWQIDVDSAFGLFRRGLCYEVRRYSSATALLWRVRQLGHRVVELPVGHRRSTIGIPASATSRAA